MVASKWFRKAVYVNYNRSAIRTYYAPFTRAITAGIMNLLRHPQAEEERQAVIDKQNNRLLQRIVDIMTSKKKTFPPMDVKEAKRKVNKLKEISEDQTPNH